MYFTNSRILRVEFVLYYVYQNANAKQQGNSKIKVRTICFSLVGSEIDPSEIGYLPKMRIMQTVFVRETDVIYAWLFIMIPKWLLNRPRMEYR